MEDRYQTSKTDIKSPGGMKNATNSNSSYINDSPSDYTNSVIIENKYPEARIASVNELLGHLETKIYDQG